MSCNGRSGGGTAAPRNAAEALKALPEPPSGMPTLAFEAKVGGSGERVKFTRQFVEAQISKPMGLVIEENHASIKVKCLSVSPDFQDRSASFWTF